jgi:hypothetical protein
MKFPVSRPDVVHAINQRWLLKFWKRHLGERRVPQWQAVEAEDLSRISENLSFLDVIGGNGTARFQIRFHGATIARVYGASDCGGRFLDDVIPVPRHASGLAPYHRALETGCPVYTIHDITDRNGLLIHFERLLLPFARSGDSVDRILASFEFVCADGAFDRNELMKTATESLALRLSAIIEPQALA